MGARSGTSKPKQMQMSWNRERVNAINVRPSRRLLSHRHPLRHRNLPCLSIISMKSEATSIFLSGPPGIGSFQSLPEMNTRLSYDQLNRSREINLAELTRSPVIVCSEIRGDEAGSRFRIFLRISAKACAARNERARDAQTFAIQPRILFISLGKFDLARSARLYGVTVSLSNDDQ